jgi:serine/threonine-protein kinase
MRGATVPTDTGTSGLHEGELIEGKYRVVRLMGSGGMGSVYEGENRRIGRRVAIKVLHAGVAGDRRLVERSEREAQAAARIGSHHIADVLDLGDLPSGERYMVMEYLEGETLAQRLASVKVMSPAHAVRIVAQLLAGLSVVHAAGIVHRDLKPANIFLARNEPGDFVKILDFGVCKFRVTRDLQWTTAGSAVLGTPGYIAPEQLLERDAVDVDASADLYSVGVLLYRCVAGRLPYDGTSHGELLLNIRDGKVRPILDVVPGLDGDFAAIVMKAIARDPAKRFRSADEFTHALLDWARALERVSNLLAEFLDRPERVTVVPPQSSRPPRFAFKSSSDEAPPPSSHVVAKSSSVEQHARTTVGAPPRVGSVDPVDAAPTDRALPPDTADTIVERANADASAAPVDATPLVRARREPSQATRAIVVGSLLGIAAAIVAYLALVR